MEIKCFNGQNVQKNKFYNINYIRIYNYEKW